MSPALFSWPPYSHLRPGHDSPPTELPLQLPATVLDIFYVRADAMTAPDLVVILGCLGGSIMVAPALIIPTLPANLQAIIRTAEVNQRGRFRVITAREVWIASLDAIEQVVQAQGYNDAVSLYGRMHARISDLGPQSCVDVLANDVCLTVGRLDLLYGWRMGFASPFHHPVQAAESITHALIPLAPCATVQEGTGMALLYPLFDPAHVSSSDNTAIVIQIVYELLLHLQHDLREHAHPLASITLPVPSRAQLEAELIADGYRIVGTTAVRESASAHSAASTSLLGRVRRWAQHWSEPSITLPPQATLGDYQQIIDGLLSAMTTPADLAMMHALLRRVDTLGSRQPPIPASTTPARDAVPNTSAQPIRPPLRSLNTSACDVSWANDFKAPPPRPVARESWWQDFPHDERAVVISTQADWSSASPPSRPSTPESLSADFGRAPDKPPESPPAADWSRDFD